MGGKVTLLVSHLGMQTQRITLNGEQTRDIVLKPDNRSLDEVVVTGYQKVRNRIYTGAASAVKMQDIRLEGVADVSKMLEGRVAGLNLQTISGTFGAALASTSAVVRPSWAMFSLCGSSMAPSTKIWCISRSISWLRAMPSPLLVQR